MNLGESPLPSAERLQHPLLYPSPLAEVVIAFEPTPTKAVIMSEPAPTEVVVIPSKSIPAITDDKEMVGELSL